jgi:hypothetical protein
MGAHGWNCDDPVPNPAGGTVTFPFPKPTYLDPKRHFSRAGKARPTSAVCLMDGPVTNFDGKMVYRQRFRKVHQTDCTSAPDIQRPVECDMTGSRVCVVGGVLDGPSPCGLLGGKGCRACTIRHVEEGQ